MKIATGFSTRNGTQAVVEAYENLKSQLDCMPDYLMLHCSVNYDLNEILTELKQLAPGIPLHGGTSCRGVITEQGYHNHEGFGLALFGISDPDGAYGVGGAVIKGDPSFSAQQAIQQALENADCLGEIPAMVFMTAMPGSEEQIISGIEDLLGSDVPVMGGSSADNDVSGQWQQLANENIYSEAVVVSVFIPSTELLFAFHSGYEPTSISGIATKVDGRVLIEIDERPAAEVYNEWTDGLIKNAIENGGNILGISTLTPLGRIAGEIGGVPYFQLSHPDSVTNKGEITLFSNIKVGERVFLMTGTVESLVSRAGRVIGSTLETHSLSADKVAGAIIIYCAGCMLTVDERINEAVDDMREALPQTPLIGSFTFGEQGCFIGGENRHGNLMISSLMFCK